MNKQLAPGSFVFVRNLPEDATEEAVSEYFREFIPTLGIDRVSVRNYVGVSSAVLSIGNQEAVHLLRWAFENACFPGMDWPLEFRVPHFSKQG